MQKKLKPWEKSFLQSQNSMILTASAVRAAYATVCFWMKICCLVGTSRFKCFPGEYNVEPTLQWGILISLCSSACIWLHFQQDLLFKNRSKIYYPFIIKHASKAIRALKAPYSCLPVFPSFWLDAHIRHCVKKHFWNGCVPYILIMKFEELSPTLKCQMQVIMQQHLMLAQMILYTPYFGSCMRPGFRSLDLISVSR